MPTNVPVDERSTATDDGSIGPRRLDDLEVGLVGPGRVGTSLALWLAAAGARVGWVVGRERASALSLADKLGTRASDTDEIMQQRWDLLLLAVPDALLESIASDLATTASGREGIALHTCGSQSAAVLAPLRAIGIHTGSLHPLLGFPSIREEPVANVVYGIDGDPDAAALAARLATVFAGRAIEIEAEHRLLYHYCATLAAGGLSTVLSVVDELMLQLGLDPALRHGYHRLAEAAVNAAGAATDTSATITGPIARGEAELADQQLQRASRAQPALAPFLKALHRETARQVMRTDARKDNDNKASYGK